MTLNAIALPDSFRRLPIAHRALHDRAAGRIENSLSAIRAAVAAGYGIEIDVQLSADGQAMVFHDETLDRLTAEQGRVNARSAVELGRIALTDGRGDTIPTLTEVLDEIAGRVPLLIEIKDQTETLAPTDSVLEAATAKALEGYRGDVALMSFNPHCIAHLARLAPDMPRGLTTCSYEAEDWEGVSPDICDTLRDIPDYNRVAATFISHEAKDLHRPRVAELKAQGADILCWTIRSPEAEALARKVAVNVTFEGYASPLTR